MSSYNPWVVYSLLFTGACGFIQWGFFLSVSGSALKYFQNVSFEGISDGRLSLIASMLTIGAAFGAFIGGPLATRIGRRLTLLIGDFIMLVGIALTLVEKYGCIITGRLIEGVIVGLNTTVVPLYILEMVPIQVRGKAGVLNSTLLTGGLVFAYGMGFTVPTDGEESQNWRINFALPAIFSILRIFILIFVYTGDTPFYNVINNREEKAMIMLKRIYRTNPEQVLEGLKKDKEFAEQSKKGEVRLRDLFTQNYRKLFAVGFVLAIIQQLCGTAAVFTFTQFIFEYGLDDPANSKLPQTFSLIVSLFNLAFVFISYFSIDRFGRKMHLVVNLFILALINFAYAVIGSVDSPGNLAAKIILLIWPIFFSLSVGALCFLYLGETLPDIGMAVVVLCNWTSSFIETQWFLDVANAIGLDGVFYIFGGLTLAATIFLGFFMIESKGKTKAEIIAEYAGTKGKVVAAEFAGNEATKQSDKSSKIMPESFQVLVSSDVTQQIDAGTTFVEEKSQL